MTNTIRILNELIDQMVLAEYLFAIVSDTGQLQYVRSLSQQLSDQLPFLNEQPAISWPILGIDETVLHNDKSAVFEFNGTEHQVHVTCIDHLLEGHYWLLMVAPPSYPNALCASILSLLNNTLTQKIVTGDFRHQVENAQQFTFAIVNSLKFGLIAVNKQGEIVYANETACTSVNMRRCELLKTPISGIIDGWDQINARAEERYPNEEVQVNTPNGKVRYNINVTPLLDAADARIGTVVSLRELGNLYQIVNKYTGMQARFSFDDIVGKSLDMRRLVDYAKTVSDSPSTVLIEGESGTGKEVFAQSIHNASSRRDAGFVAVNCAAISESLVESELFGYDDGAFTGAAKGGKPGKFELANGGTLFLDEIGEMKPDMQVKLLRAIQESAITRVGSSKVVPVDVRIIAATNKNLKKEVETGRFRLDLYYRLSVIPLKIPPLRERKSDLPALIRIFLQKKSSKLNKAIPTFHYTEFQKLLDYNWPGNIRELENFVEQWVNLNGHFTLDYFLEQLKPLATETSTTATAVQTECDAIALSSLSEMERQLIKQTIAFFNGNMTQVAKNLKISRNTLYLKTKKHGLDSKQLS